MRRAPAKKPRRRAENPHAAAITKANRIAGAQAASSSGESPISRPSTRPFKGVSKSPAAMSTNAATTCTEKRTIAARSAALRTRVCAVCSRFLSGLMRRLVSPCTTPNAARARSGSTSRPRKMLMTKTVPISADELSMSGHAKRHSSPIRGGGPAAAGSARK